MHTIVATVLLYVSDWPPSAAQHRPSPLHPTPLPTPCHQPSVFFFLASSPSRARRAVRSRQRTSRTKLGLARQRSTQCSSPPRGRLLRLEQRLFRHIGSIVQYLAVWNMQGNCIPTPLLHNSVIFGPFSVEPTSDPTVNPSHLPNSTRGSSYLPV